MERERRAPVQELTPPSEMAPMAPVGVAILEDPSHVLVGTTEVSLTPLEAISETITRGAIEEAVLGEVGVQSETGIQHIVRADDGLVARFHAAGEAELAAIATQPPETSDEDFYAELRDAGLAVSDGQHDDQIIAESSPVTNDQTEIADSVDETGITDELQDIQRVYAAAPPLAELMFSDMVVYEAAAEPLDDASAEIPPVQAAAEPLGQLIMLHETDTDEGAVVSMDTLSEKAQVSPSSETLRLTVTAEQSNPTELHPLTIPLGEFAASAALQSEAEQSEAVQAFAEGDEDDLEARILALNLEVEEIALQTAQLREGHEEQTRFMLAA